MPRITKLERTLALYRDRPDQCWIYQGYHSPAGYGEAWLDGEPVHAHRAMYLKLVGPIPNGMQLDHLCRNPPCCNPRHLEPVTPRENQRRSPVSLAARNLAKTHCAKGHPYDEANTQYTPQGGRRCAECNRQKSRDRLAKRGPLPPKPLASHCGRGHLLDEANTVWRGGQRRCGACVNQWKADAYRRAHPDRQMPEYRGYKPESRYHQRRDVTAGHVATPIERA